MPIPPTEMSQSLASIANVERTVRRRQPPLRYCKTGRTHPLFVLLAMLRPQRFTVLEQEEIALICCMMICLNTYEVNVLQPWPTSDPGSPTRSTNASNAISPPSEAQTLQAQRFVQPSLPNSSSAICQYLGFYSTQARHDRALFCDGVAAL